MSTIGDVLSGRAQWAVLEADCSMVLPMLPERSVDHVIGDPPFSARVHAGQSRQDGDGGVVPVGLGFGPLDAWLRDAVAGEAIRAARRWVVLKSDLEGTSTWLQSLEAAGARWTRFGVWWKDCAQPQFTGDRPANGLEGMAIAHAPGIRMRWNGGGKHARWRHPIARGDRVHPTETPISLWMEILADFTDPGELVLDPFCGSGSLGIACVRLGRRYLGMDNGKDANGKPWAEWAREGIRAEEQGLSRGPARVGQMGLFA
jgi:site-specific DNA-methyltransferase (adenine-specific)